MKARPAALAVLALAVLVGGCSPSPPGFPRGRLNHVWMSRERCYGSCPVYMVQILRDGRVIYEGQDNVVVIGRHEGRASPEQMATLLAAVKAADFYRLEDAYYGAVIHSVTRRMSITVGDDTRMVSETSGEAGGGMPKAVLALEAAIDEAAGTRRWVKGDASTLPALRAEGFDFASDQAGEMLRQSLRDGPSDLVQALIEGGALKTQEDRDFALRSVATCRRDTLIGPLLKAGARVDARGDGDETALLKAAGDSHAYCDQAGDGVATVRALLAAGANPKAMDGSGATPLRVADDGDIKNLLIAAGARP